MNDRVTKIELDASLYPPDLVRSFLDSSAGASCSCQEVATQLTVNVSEEGDYRELLNDLLIYCVESRK